MFFWLCITANSPCSSHSKFSKAFDTVPHFRLLLKLRDLSCAERVIRGFVYFFTGRVQAVRLGHGSHEEWLSTNQGLPPGGVLSPLLITVYAKDVSDASLHLSFAIDADSMTIYIHYGPKDLPGHLHQLFSYAYRA